jgi:hypothetical protein
MAYDTSRARLVLVGGFGPAGRSDTWEHDGTTWQLVQPMVSAPTVGQSAAVYDVFGRKVVCFDANGFTLEYDGATWRRLLPSASPPRLILHAMAYDAARRRVVLFGGGEPIGNIIWRNDTWEFDGTSWSQVPVTSPPQPRGFHGMAYDHARRRVILFGGDVQRAAMNDTWLYDGVAWAQAFPPTSPPPQDNNTLVYDAQRGRTILIGDSTWEFDGTTWSPIPPGVAPSLRYSTSAAYDMARGRVVLFGGQDVVDQLVTADTWELEPPRTPSWTAYGTGCAAGGVEPGLVVPAAIVPALGATVTFQLSALPPRAGAVLLEFGRDLLHCSGSALPVELPWLPPGCAGWIEPEPGFATLIVHGGNVASWSFTIPNRPVLAGLVIGQQGIVLDHPAPHGIHGLTNAGILRIF